MKEHLSISILAFGAMIVGGSCAELPNPGQRVPADTSTPLVAWGKPGTIPISSLNALSSDVNADDLVLTIGDAVLDVAVVGGQLTFLVDESVPTGFQTLTIEDVDGNTLFEDSITVLEECFDCDDPASNDKVLITAAWESDQAANIDIAWLQPSNRGVSINSCGFTPSCSESVNVDRTGIEDGLQALDFTLNQTGRPVEYSYLVEFLNYRFSRFAGDERVVNDRSHLIGIDVVDGDAFEVYNDWFDSDDSRWIQSTGRRLVEIVGGWQNSPSQANVDVRLTLPTGRNAAVERNNGFDSHGFDRIAIANGTTISDGTYQVVYDASPSSRSVEMGFLLDFADVSLRHTETVLEDVYRTAAIDFSDGDAHVLFNGWPDTAQGDAGSLSGKYGIEVNAGWKNAPPGRQVNVDINVREPDGTSLTVWRNGFQSQGFERAVLPQGVPLDDGVYELTFQLDLDTAEITYHAQVADWKFEAVTDQVVAAGTSHSITVEVLNGQARELTNTWRE